MKALRFKFFVLIALITCSCSEKFGPIYHLPIPGEVYTSHGSVTHFKIDNSKPKVLTLIAGLEQLEVVYSHTPPDKINKIIAENTDYEFLFYFVFEKQDSLLFFQKLEKYNIDYPVFADYDDLLRKENPQLKGVGVYSIICNRENRFVAGSTIGTTQSYFDETFAKARNRIK